MSFADQTERVNGTLVNIICKTIHDLKKDWDVKLTMALWVYQTIFEMTTYAIPFSLVYGFEPTLPIEFKVESLQIAIQSCLMDS